MLASTHTRSDPGKVLLVSALGFRVLVLTSRDESCQSNLDTAPSLSQLPSTGALSRRLSFNGGRGSKGFYFSLGELTNP